MVNYRLKAATTSDRLDEKREESMQVHVHEDVATCSTTTSSRRVAVAHAECGRLHLADKGRSDTGVEAAERASRMNSFVMGQHANFGTCMTLG